jgi:hypothetical protein
LHLVDSKVVLFGNTRAGRKVKGDKAMKAQVFTRSQHAKGGGGGFRGPDIYVAVVERPDELPELPEGTMLQRDRLKKKGYIVRYCGEGYSMHWGPKSMLGKAVRYAHELAGRINGNYSGAVTDVAGFAVSPSEAPEGHQGSLAGAFGSSTSG